MKRLNASGWIENRDQTRRSASSWHAVSFRLTILHHRLDPKSSFHTAGILKKNNDTHRFWCFDYVAKSAHAYDILWYSYCTDVTANVSRHLSGEKKKTKTRNIFSICQWILKAKKTKQNWKMEFWLLLLLLLLLCYLNGGMSLWHSQLLARQHGLLPIIPGWRWDFSTPRGGAEKAKLLRLSKLFCARCETDHLRSMGPMRKKKIHIERCGVFS